MLTQLLTMSLLLQLYGGVVDKALIANSEKQAKSQEVYAATEKVHTYKQYDIPLSNDLQKYIYNQAEKYDLSYELMLAIAHTESTFRPDVVSYDGSSVGLFQINTRNTINWLGENVGLDKPNAKNPYHATKMASWYVNYLKEKYLNEGYKKDNVIKRVLIGYRYGVGKSAKYVRQNGLHHKYIDKVLAYKNKLESGELDAK
ncbi:transglycosylase SLT domain-containing protein [Brevibacillus laterosporus]|uniref:transglycosylase SLT domain-containing protein n=1 Tax=Brevibacillus laterosporus TaxID=1465 RepID=UPI001EF32AD1|nr:transglycosylase SLT domain-containing protein [Brevibacillus laterosporus]MCG7317619.1 lytic transglycosylase domain-containing protein [Brevibacillus laterosporus]